MDVTVQNIFNITHFYFFFISLLFFAHLQRTLINLLLNYVLIFAQFNPYPTNVENRVSS